MSTEILIGRRESGEETRFRLDVFQEGEHWTSTLVRLDRSGRPEEVRVAPRFYGTTAEQARRRMIQVLENQFDEVRATA